MVFVDPFSPTQLAAFCPQQLLAQKRIEILMKWEMMFEPNTKMILKTKMLETVSATILKR